MRLEDSHLTTSSGAPSYCEVQRYVSKQILRQRSHFWRRFVIYAIFLLTELKKTKKQKNNGITYNFSAQWKLVIRRGQRSLMWTNSLIMVNLRRNDAHMTSL